MFTPQAFLPILFSSLDYVLLYIYCIQYVYVVSSIVFYQPKWFVNECIKFQFFLFHMLQQRFRTASRLLSCSSMLYTRTAIACIFRTNNQHVQYGVHSRGNTFQYLLLPSIHTIRLNKVTGSTRDPTTEGVRA